MPLLAYTQSGEPLVAPLISVAEWEQLRSSTERDAWMPESRRRAIPKVSRLGTRFFAHPPGHAPEGGRESDLHLYLKAQCLIGARAAGWDALPEQSGRTPDGQDWRADVLCHRPGQSWSIALEAQVQLQGEETYRKRQARFAASGIRGLWLVAHEPAALHQFWRKPEGTCRRSGPASGKMRRAARPLTCTLTGSRSVSLISSPGHSAGSFGGTSTTGMGSWCWSCARTSAGIGPAASRSYWPSGLKRQAETHSTSRPFRSWRRMRVLMPRRRLLFQIWRTAPGHSGAFSRPAALTAGERCATSTRARQAGMLLWSGRATRTDPQASRFACHLAFMSQSQAL